MGGNHSVHHHSQLNVIPSSGTNALPATCSHVAVVSAGTQTGAVPTDSPTDMTPAAFISNGSKLAAESGLERHNPSTLLRLNKPKRQSSVDAKGSKFGWLGRKSSSGSKASDRSSLKRDSKTSPVDGAPSSTPYRPLGVEGWRMIDDDSALSGSEHDLQKCSHQHFAGPSNIGYQMMVPSSSKADAIDIEMHTRMDRKNCNQSMVKGALCSSVVNPCTLSTSADGIQSDHVSQMRSFKMSSDEQFSLETSQCKVGKLKTEMTRRGTAVADCGVISNILRPGSHDTPPHLAMLPRSQSTFEKTDPLRKSAQPRSLSQVVSLSSNPMSTEFYGSTLLHTDCQKFESITSRFDGPDTEATALANFKETTLNFEPLLKPEGKLPCDGVKQTEDVVARRRTSRDSGHGSSMEAAAIQSPVTFASVRLQELSLFSSGVPPAVLGFNDGSSAESLDSNDLMLDTDLVFCDESVHGSSRRESMLTDYGEEQRSNSVVSQTGFLKQSRSVSHRLSSSSDRRPSTVRRQRSSEPRCISSRRDSSRVHEVNSRDYQDFDAIIELANLKRERSG